jgi:uncharacterized zinc-type alcohol dehydrogenase-like protein
VRGEWGEKEYPVVPGHEIVGIVAEVGDGVVDFEVGDRVGVGVIVDSCRECDNCVDGLENYCNAGPVFTYGSPEEQLPGALTYGGYSRSIVVTEDFVFDIPDNLDPAGVAPLLCAGITVYSPLRHWGVGPGMVVGVAGIGGLGHMAVKFAAAMGAHVVALTSSDKKSAMARELGANDVLVTSDEAQMAEWANRFDVIVSTLPSNHNPNPYINLLAVDGAYVIVGAVEEIKHPLNVPALISRRRMVAGSMIGGLPETQEMLDFCGEHGITAEVEVIDAAEINVAYDRVVAGDVHFRFVIDAATI